MFIHFDHTVITQILNRIWIFFSQTHVSGGVNKTILLSIISVTFNLDACKVDFEKRLPNVKHV